MDPNNDVQIFRLFWGTMSNLAGPQQHQTPIYMFPASSSHMFVSGNTSYGGCRKFLLLFGRIGPLTLRPCALLRAWGFLPHSINILQIPLWYGDMMWYGVSCARPCALLRGPAFLMPLYHALKILSPPKMWLKGRFFFIINPHIAYICFCFDQRRDFMAPLFWMIWTIVVSRRHSACAASDLDDGDYVFSLPKYPMLSGMWLEIVAFRCRIGKYPSSPAT